MIWQNFQEFTSPKVSRALMKTDSRFRGQVWSPAVKCTLFFPYSELGRPLSLLLKRYISSCEQDVCNGVEIYDDRDEGPVRMWT